VNGVLGGFAEVHQPDMIDSCIFINRVFAERPKGTAVDCGAGIGRVTKAVLSRFFDRIDLVEQCGAYVETARAELDLAKIGEFYTMGL
jgi:protein N-terminal methyltransferase